MLKIDPNNLASVVSKHLGLVFISTQSFVRGETWIDLIPADHPRASSFRIRLVMGWRHIEVLFKPGNFSGELLESMRQASNASKELFYKLLLLSQDQGADIKLQVDGRRFSVGDNRLWDEKWVNVVFRVRVGQSELGPIGEKGADESVQLWVSRLVAAVFCLMPVERTEEQPDFERFPEGSSVSIQVNRYERDPRNRAAALAIHGYQCMACKTQMSDVYGAIAEGLIEVHHTTPLSTLEAEYLVDPAKELIPLCPNCHRVIHRSDPPLTLSELIDTVEESQKK